MKKPKFLILGAPKAGTSSLYEYLRKHPDIFLPARKELHFFSHELISKNIKGPGDEGNLKDVCFNEDDYLSFFSEAGTDQAVCELSTSYFYQIGSYIGDIERVLGGDLKIVVVLRDPVKRCFSNYQHQKRNGLETETFERSLELEGERRLQQWATFWRYSDQSYYYDNLKVLKDHFGSSAILIIRQEDLTDNAHVELKKIYDFIGVKGDFIPDNINIRYNRSGVYKRRMLIDWMMKPSGLRKTLKSIAPTAMVEQLRKKRDTFISSNTIKVETINPKTAQRLYGQFGEDMEKLKAEFGCSWK